MMPTVQDFLERDGALIVRTTGGDQRESGQLVRLHRNGQEVLWGYLDEGEHFVCEGGAPLPPTAASARTLALKINTETYDILVDGQVISEGLPLRGRSGWIGLIAYRGPATYSDFS